MSSPSQTQLARIEKVTVPSGPHVELKSILGVSLFLCIYLFFVLYLRL